MNVTQSKKELALKQELRKAHQKELRLEKAAFQVKESTWLDQQKQKIPPKVYDGLESAFCKGFSLVFCHGKNLIEKSYRKELLQTNHNIQDYAVQMKGGRKELKQLSKSSRSSGLLNMAVSTVEGIGLGALGIGMPDIVLFIGMLLRGTYETALHYGFEYESRREQLFILKLLETSLTTGPEWISANSEVDRLMKAPTFLVTEKEFQTQLNQTASTFAMDMLFFKFIQGLPVIGMVGGAANPIYYRKVMKYVKLKYHQRYLRKLASTQ